MKNESIYLKELSENGFTIIDNVFSEEEITTILECIESSASESANFRKTDDLFAIRQFLKEIPEAVNKIFTNRFGKLIDQLFGGSFFPVKSIYFDKPQKSNWFVAYHQDLTISADKKVEVPGFGPWTIKKDQFAVQPPLFILQNNFTIRIHLDDTNEENGALKVIPGSHLKGIYRPETIDWLTEKEVFCNVKRGGIMIMKPLLLHASNRTVNEQKRRVIHIEFSDQQLPEPLNWSEKTSIYSDHTLSKVK